MEIEMKYGIADKERAEEIWEDPQLLAIGDLDSRETVLMKAVYFDTEDHVLSENDMAFRVRMEGSRIVASLKWNGSVVDGYHTREELNVPVTEESYLIDPPTDLFKESEQGKALLELVGDKRLVNMMENRFLRRKMRADSGSAICEIAIDTGEIVTDGGSMPICELEIELYSGEPEEIKAIGASLAEKYGLVPENRSKYARGLSLARKGK
ncbi:CYTH domain-containing protein [Bacilliculturomica massiliensis]|uniref:CYTH domain-containing protein n=1 Tax=Bacilliculturomica massiliensis TaxID=1917867 RepID=UPI001030B38F|nr:CYTH domain-containing protein [Bacilliculturomica massiliensis]